MEIIYFFEWTKQPERTYFVVVRKRDCFGIALKLLEWLLPDLTLDGLWKALSGLNIFAPILYP